MNKVSLKKYNVIISFILIIETLIIKLFQYSIFPAKYFFDSEKILAIMNGSQFTDKAYSFTANFFNKINILELSNIKQWSWLIGIVFLIFFVIYFAKRKINYMSGVYIIASFALLNIYVFNLSKDIIQLLFFILVYFICSSKRMTDDKKIFASALIFFLESFFFRTYYLIMAILIVSIYCIYKIFFKEKKKKTVFIVFLSFTCFMIMIYVLQKVSTENYMLLIKARSNSNIYRDSTDAVTMINDVLENTNYFNFVINYIINTIRILFPFELIFKGIKYFPFVIYQMFISYVLIKNAKSVKKDNILFLIILMAFIMVSIIFEPDFGSVVRHESVLILFVLQLILNERGNKCDTEKSIDNNTNL